jgi:hypothetical protein
MGTGEYFSVVKRPGREAYHSPPSRAEVKKESVEPYLHSPIRLQHMDRRRSVEVGRCTFRNGDVGTVTNPGKTTV